MACNESRRVNVGDPGRPQGSEYWRTRLKIKNSEKPIVMPGSQTSRSTDEVL
ncbi:MAG TPA: hypothetical protein VHA52_02560 [Candidatus Babeliaceae bacterium]|nr:hypothetical protein [Candidatus Babeliaceae bacterium]